MDSKIEKIAFPVPGAAMASTLGRFVPKGISGFFGGGAEKAKSLLKGTELAHQAKKFGRHASLGGPLGLAFTLWQGYEGLKSIPKGMASFQQTLPKLAAENKKTAIVKLLGNLSQGAANVTGGGLEAAGKALKGKHGKILLPSGILAAYLSPKLIEKYKNRQQDEYYSY